MNVKLIKSLLTPEAYPEPTQAVRLIETHVSYIFLTDTFVYKIKKAVDFGFLNFSTIDRRRFYCGEEVRLNRRLCPELYLGVVEVRETAQGLSLSRDGKVVEYAVKMKRLPEERMLGRLLAAGEVGPAQMHQIAEVIARFHLEAPVVPQTQPYGGPDAIRSNWVENFRHATGGNLPAPGDLSLITDYVQRFMRENDPLFRARVAGGFVRECDGDLHVDNICLTDRVHIFDCIEFNDNLRFTDTAADVAFLLMDLEYHERPDLAASFLERYLEITGDRGMLPLLGFYQAYRAFVRGKVALLRLQDETLSAGERGALTESARRYFTLCRGYTLRDRLPPTLFLTCGYLGSGKSTLARQLSFQLGTQLVRSDAVRKELAGRKPGRSRSIKHGTGIYAPAFDEKVYAELLRRAEAALAAGDSVVVDATFRSAGERERFREMAARRDVPVRMLVTVCGEETIRKRLEARRHHPEEISDGRWEIFAAHKAAFEPVTEAEGALRVSCEAPPERCADEALRALRLLP